MPIQENALNSALAEALAPHNLHAPPEQTNAKTGAKRCDVQIRRKHGDRYFTAVECKIGQGITQRHNAIKDAQRWLRQADCWNAIALCYPNRLSKDSRQGTSGQRLTDAADLLMVRVNQSGPIGRWHLGNLTDLARLADDIGVNETYAITDILQRAILAASEQIDIHTGQDLAEILELPWDPGKGHVDIRPARIACLIIANMALLQNRIRSEGVRIPDLGTLIEIHRAPNRQATLLDNWQRIRAVDYAPVVDPALAVLHKLPTDHLTENLLDTLIEAVLECAPRIRGLQFDHAGPLYHGLLQTARYDGSFYTSTSAAVLLAELAMPPDWLSVGNGWIDANNLVNLKICDPACGTGTLLMATARTIQERFRSAGGNDEDFETLHLGLIEDVLYGLDINRHAIHLAACMLTLSAPKIDYNKMHLYNMHHGVNTKGKIRAGSLDILTNSAGYLPGLAPDTRQRRTVAGGYKDEAPDLGGVCDLVIMNPPFTRNDIRNRSLPPEVRKKVQAHEIELAKKTGDPTHRNAIDQTAMNTFFSPIADILLGRHGTLAMVAPFASCMGAGVKNQRNLLTDPTRFHLELVVTSHDNRRISFSENTDIHESLIVARRPTLETQKKATAFVSLAENPASVSEAHYLADAIQQAINGDTTQLANYGTIAWRSLEQLRNRSWNAACFYDQSLADAYDTFLENPALAALGTLAAVEPEGRRIRDAFTKAAKRQNPDMRALWAHQSARQTTMRTSPDKFLVAKKGKQKYARHLWEKRSNLLVANRMRLNLTQTPAVFSDERILGSAFVPVLPTGQNKELFCKAWCVWLNSTLGIVAFLNTRQKNLTYPNFSLDGLRSLLVPNPDACDMAALATAYDKYAEHTLCPLPEIDHDPVRHALDDTVSEAVPGISRNHLAEWQRSIALEPSVNNKKDPFQLD